MKESYTPAEVMALIDAAMKEARKKEAKWDSNAYEARHARYADAYNTEYVKGIAEGYGMALNDFKTAFDAAFKEAPGA